MLRRPWPLVILSLLYMIGPALNIWVSARLMKIGVISYLNDYLFRVHWTQIAIVLFAYPVAGFSIFMMRRWSYPVFLFVVGTVTVMNFRAYLNAPEIFSAWAFVLVNVLNVGIVTYFLMPAVRNVYFDRKVRWWQTRPRYKVEIPAQLSADNQWKHPAVISNFSQGGAFVRSEVPLPSGDILLIFSFFGHELQVKGRYTHYRELSRLSEGDTAHGYGVQFQLNRQQRKILRNIANELRVNGYDVTLQAAPWHQDFVRWVNLVKKGRGLLPEVPQRHTNQ